MTTFARLTRPKLRALAPGESLHEHGITFTRLANGDGRWSVNVMVQRRRVHQVVGTESAGFTRTQAEELVAKLKAAKYEAAHGIRKDRARPVALSAAVDAYLAHLERIGGKDAPKKRQRLRMHVCRLLGGVQLHTLRRSDLQAYAKTRQDEGASPATVNRELAAVSHLLRLAASPDDLALLPGVPFRVPLLREPKGRTVYLNAAEADALLAAAQRDQSPHVLAFVMVGLHTGMRLSAILRIRIDEIDVDRCVIWVDKDKAGEREQPMTTELADFLRTYIAHIDGPWLFPSDTSDTGHAVNISKAFRRVVKAAGLPAAVTPHKLRHTMATTAAARGVDPATLQAIGGWKSRAMVERYTHASALSEAMAKLSAGYTVPGKLHQDHSEPE